jgi:hypothetical protein
LEAVAAAVAVQLLHLVLVAGAVMVHRAQVHKDLGVDKAILVQAVAGAVY